MIAIRCTRNEFYSWDSAPAVLYGWLLTIMVSYIGAPRRSKTLLAAAVLALVVLARVPAGLVAWLLYPSDAARGEGRWGFVWVRRRS